MLLMTTIVSTMKDELGDVNMKIEMIGYNDGKSIGIHSYIKLRPFAIASLVFSIILLLPAFVFQMYELLVLLILPVIFILVIFFIFIVKSKYTTFLKGKKIKHYFRFENGSFFKDGKEIKSKDKIRLYKFKRFLFLEFKNSYYRIENDDYLVGNREGLLDQLNILKKNYVRLALPPKTKEEIVELLFNRLNPKAYECLFYSLDRTRIIYIYKNDVGSYSIGYEKIVIADDHEREFTNEYGWWEHDYLIKSISFYGTKEEALNDIKNEIIEYIKY